jgi:hypothetical protein
MVGFAFTNKKGQDITPQPHSVIIHLICDSSPLYPLADLSHRRSPSAHTVSFQWIKNMKEDEIGEFENAF